MRFPTGRAQSAALIAFGAFAVHQLRYLLAAGPGAEEQLPRQSGDLLAHALPLAVGLLLAALSARLVSSLIGGREAERERRLRATTYALGIVAIFCCQELLAGALVAGHASGAATLFAAGGWAALPLAALFGVLAALVDRGIEAVEARLGFVPLTESRRPHSSVFTWRGSRLRSRLAPLAFGLARRPPPATA